MLRLTFEMVHVAVKFEDGASNEQNQIIITAIR